MQGCRGLLALALVAATASACSGGHHRPSHALPDDGWRVGDVALLAKASGEFHAILTSGGACAWMGDRQGTFSYSWPTDYRVRFDPTELLDPTGHVVAREGERIESAGGFTGEVAGIRGHPQLPVVDTWCGHPGQSVFAVQGAVQRAD